MNIIVFGPPGSGKGTQSKRLTSHIKVKHVSFGDVLRSHVQEKTSIGIKVKSILDRGELVGSELMKEVLEDQVASAFSYKGLIFDGFPRNVEQAELLQSLFEEIGMKIGAIIYLDVPDEIVKERIKERAKIEGRSDDQDESKINKRLAIYHSETKPVLDYYREKNGNLVHKIDGSKSFDEIFETIKKKVEKIAKI